MLPPRMNSGEPLGLTTQTLVDGHSPFCFENLTSSTFRIIIKKENFVTELPMDKTAVYNGDT